MGKLYLQIQPINNMQKRIGTDIFNWKQKNAVYAASIGKTFFLEYIMRPVRPLLPHKVFLSPLHSASPRHSSEQCENSRCRCLRKQPH